MVLPGGLYYKPMMIVNDDPRVVNNLETLLTYDARVIIYHRHVFIVQTTGGINCQFIYPNYFSLS
jgi:hypothetical protein